MAKVVGWIIFSLALFVSLDGISECMGQDLVGGLWNDEKPASMEVRRIINVMKPQITDKIKSQREGFYFQGSMKPVSYKIQIVNGINYFIKIRAKIGKKNTFYHVRVHKDFGDDGALTLVNLHGPMRTHADIQFF